MTTPILKIPEVADGQVDQYLTYNEALRLLESSANEIVSLDLSASDVTITDATPDYIFSRNAIFKSTDNTVTRVLTVPASKRLFVVWNSGSASLTVKRGTAEFAVDAGSSGLFYADGNTDGLIAIASGGGGGASVDTFDTAAVASNAIDLSVYNAVWIVALDDDVTSITLPTAATGQVLSMLILFSQDAVGGHTVTGWGSAIFESGSAPVIDTTAETITSVPVLILGNGDVYVVG